MSASVICVDLSSESDEESPAGKRRRLEDPLRPMAPTGRQTLPAKLMNIPKASLGSPVGVGVPVSAGGGPARASPVPVDPLRSMHIPSGITVTKHQKNILTTNGNLTISLAENNNNNTNSYNNNNNTNVIGKPVKMGAAQKVAWSVSSKAPSPNALITSVPSHQVRVTPGNQIRLAPGAKVIQSPIGVTPKTIPAKIQPPVGIGQPQKPIILGVTKPKAPMGQMLQLQQQQKTLPAQQKVLPGQQQQQRASLGQLQQQQLQLQHQLQQQQQQQPARSLGSPMQQQQKLLGLQQKALARPSPQQKTAVGGQFQQQQKAIVGQQQQRASLGQSQPQLPQQKAAQVQVQQQKPLQKKQNPQKPSVGQLQLHQQIQQQQQQHIAALVQMQQQQQQRISMGQLQQQQLQLQQVSQKAGQMQQQQRALLGHPQLPKVPTALLRPQNPLTSAQQQQQSPKTQMAQQLMNSVLGEQSPVQQPSLPVVNQITHKSMTIQKLPMLQKAPTAAKVPPKQIFPQQAPPPAHLVQKQTPPQAPLQTPPFAHRPPIVRPATVTKITTVPSRAGFQMKPQVPGATAVMSAARTLPFRSSTAHKAATPPLTSTHLQGFTASATPPQRLLATPPHCAAALNEPLLLNLPPTTSITPQLTPTTTPPPAGIPAAVQQLAKAAAFKLNSLPGASISPVTKVPATTTAKRIQPITVLKKSDEEWRRHILEQQQQQQRQREQLQSSSTPTIVLVESPPTTPPTEKPETEKTPPIKSSTTDKQASNLKRPAIVTPPLKNSVNVEPEIVDLDALPETPPKKRKTEDSTPVKKPPQEASPPAKAAFTPEYAALIKLCRQVDPSEDMERLSKGKLTKYYYSVHESFVASRGFRKMVEQAMERIRSESDMVYVHLKYVVDELKARRVAKVVKPAARESPQPRASTPKEQQRREEKKERDQEQDQEQTQEEKEEEEEAEPEPDSPTTDKRKDERIRQLNRTLYTITKRIKMLEDADVDLNDEDSSYLQVERFKKRACQIYEKICDLTGESKKASRQLKQPIQFKDTAYTHFNRTLSAFVNKMREFPDYHDVLQILEHCNKEKELGLASFEMKRIAYDAFAKVGRLLQSRRKTDLYETVTHFTANVKDPAASDPELLAKLKENNRKQTKISDVLEKYAREQDLNAEERQEARLKEKKLKQERAEEEAAKLAALAVDDDKPCTSAQAAAKEAAIAALMKSSSSARGNGNGIERKRSIDAKVFKLDDDGEDSEEESDTEDEEDDVDEFVDNFKANGEVSDADSEAEEESAAAEEDVIDITRAETGKKIDEAPPNGKLKIMSVSSLNANFVHGQDPHTKPHPKPVIADEIIISDEES
ncbi:daxx-like protein [Drosophila takahashii]|uniref:daxx-like protein n=1 Tax=Drosophila takahashii TaxID=29030 RepID=UPI0038991F38